jgi:ferrous-iron efflux pump FieF
MAGMELKQRTALLSLSVATSLAALKLTAGVLTGSVAVLASLADSVLDLFASLLNFLAIRKASVPADLDHAYGHGKAESLAGLFQSLIIGGSGAYLIYVAILRLVHPVPLEHESVGLAVMGVSIVASWLLVRHMRKVAARTGSVALEADSLHYATDVLANLGVIASLGLHRFLGLRLADPVVSLAIAAYVLASAWQILRKSVDDLMDRQLPEPQIARITEIVGGFAPQVVGYHDLRTRHAGSQIFIELHLDIPGDRSFEQAHRVTEAVVRALEQAFPQAMVTAHSDPYPGPRRDPPRLPESHAAQFLEEPP